MHWDHGTSHEPSIPGYSITFVHSTFSVVLVGCWSGPGYCRPLEEPDSAASCRGVCRNCANPGASVRSFRQRKARPSNYTRQPLRFWPLGRRSGCSPAESYPPPRLSFILMDVLPSCSHPRAPTSCRPTISGFFRLAIALGEDNFAESRELVGWRAVTCCICKRQLLQ